MTRSKRLQPLVRIAASRQHAAAGELVQSRRLATECESRLAELRGYQQEYECRWEDAANAGVSAERMKEGRLFLERLNDAIREIHDRLVAARQQTDERWGEWLSQRTRCRALEELVERLRSTERLDAVRREQREADDRAQRGGGEGPA